MPGQIDSEKGKARELLHSKGLLGIFTIVGCARYSNNNAQRMGYGGEFGTRLFADNIPVNMQGQR